MNISNGFFGKAQTVTLVSSAGLHITLCALGAGIMSIKVPDRDATLREVTRLSEKGYGADYHGMTIGRTAGRIAGATFTFDDKTANLQKNNFGVDNLHGGKDGLHGKLFELTVTPHAEYTDVVFTYDSPDGEGGYFGSAKISVTYRVYENERGFDILFEGKPDCRILLNLTNHVYFNMSGDLRVPVTEQLVYLNSSRVGVLNERLITEKTVEVSPEFDFRTPRKMGEYISNDNVQKYTHGYDHPFFLDARGLDKTACSLYSELSGIKLEVKTTYPCVVVFGDNFCGYKSTCFECQYHPDGIHQTPDDCGVCSPDKPYRETISYRFSCE